jgi:hypothetical protein
MAFPVTPSPVEGFEIERHYNVLVSEFDSGCEQRRRLLRFPKRKIHLEYNNISRTDRDTLSNYWQTMNGSYTDFHVFDWTSRAWHDEYVTTCTGTSTGPYDLHGKTISTGTLVIWYNGSTTHTIEFYSSSGTDGAACINLTTGTTAGALVTSYFDGKLRIRARFGKDFAFKESAGYRGRFSCVIDLEEVQW